MTESEEEAHISPAPATPDPDAALWDSLDAVPGDEADAEPEFQEEEDVVPGPTLQDVRDDLAAGSAEARRSRRRTMDVLKEFGTSLTSLSEMVRDLHTTARTAAPAAAEASSALPKEWALALIDLHDRATRLSTAFQKTPGPQTAWWPGSQSALAPWSEAWSAQQGAASIFSGHLDTLLTRAGLQRIPAAGQAFDPATMSAIEVGPADGVPDHHVLAELLPGWLVKSTGQILRPAQVRVARRS